MKIPGFFLLIVLYGVYRAAEPWNTTLQGSLSGIFTTGADHGLVFTPSPPAGEGEAFFHQFLNIGEEVVCERLSGAGGIAVARDTGETSPRVFIGWDAQNKLTFNSRQLVLGNTTFEVPAPVGYVPKFVRTVADAASVYAFQSSDGQQWLPVAGIDLPLEESARGGVLATNALAVRGLTR